MGFFYTDHRNYDRDLERIQPMVEEVARRLRGEQPRPRRTRIADVLRPRIYLVWTNPNPPRRRRLNP
jgi:hypothetical protein